MTEVKDAQGVPALGISMNTSIDGQTQLVLQTHITLDALPEEADQIIDRMYRHTERLQKKTSLGLLKAKETHLEKTIVRAQEDMVRLDERHAAERSDTQGRRNPPAALTNKQKVDREAAELSITRWKEDLVGVRDQIKMVEEI